MTVTEFWDYCHRPENETRFLDLSRGRVVEWPRPTRKQGVVAAQLALALGQYELAVGGGYATLACGVILGPNRDTVRGIDAGYFTDSSEGDGWATVPPRLAVHITGPEDDPSELVCRIDDFLGYGTPPVWLIRPEECSVEVIRRDLTTQTLTAGGSLVDVPELPGFACQVADFFRLPGQPAA